MDITYLPVAKLKTVILAREILMSKFGRPATIAVLNNPTLLTKSGMETRVLKVDEKGRVHLPKELRVRLGIKNEVRAKIENGAITMEPITEIMDRLAAEVKFSFKRVEKALPSLRRAAQEELLTEVR